MSPALRRASWLVLLVVAVVALVAGTVDGGPPRTAEERGRDLALTIRCPTCRSQSAAESDAPTAAGVRTEIARRIRAGQSDGEIRAYFASRYGDEILLKPPSDGLSALVWALPAGALAAGVVGLVAAFRRWRRSAEPSASEDDRRLVDRARGRVPAAESR